MTSRPAALVCLATLLWATPGLAQRMHDDDIRKILIEESSPLYRPLSVSLQLRAQRQPMRGGKCLQQGRAPDLLCYSADVRGRMIHDYRVRRGLR